MTSRLFFAHDSKREYILVLRVRVLCNSESTLLFTIYSSSCVYDQVLDFVRMYDMCFTVHIRSYDVYVHLQAYKHILVLGTCICLRARAP